MPVVVAVLGEVGVAACFMRFLPFLLINLKKKVLFHSTMGGVILRLGILPEPWESENTSEDLRRA